MAALAATRRFLDLVARKAKAEEAAATAATTAGASTELGVKVASAAEASIAATSSTAAAAASPSSALNANEDDSEMGGESGPTLSREERRRLKKKRKQLDRGTASLASVVSGGGKQKNGSSPAGAASAATAVAAATPTSLEAIYGARAQAALELKLSSYLVNGRSSLRSAELQQLLLWVLGDANLAESPKWCFVRSKPLVQQVLLVLLDGVTETHFKTYRADYERVFAPHFGADAKAAPQPQPIRLATAHSAFARASVLQDYLACPIVRDRVAEQQQARKKQRNNAGAAVAIDEDSELQPVLTPEQIATQRALHLEQCLLNDDVMRTNLYPLPSKADQILFRRTCTPQDCSMHAQPSASQSPSSSPMKDAASVEAAALTATEIAVRDAASVEDPANEREAPLLPMPSPPAEEQWDAFPCVHVPLPEGSEDAAAAAVTTPAASAANESSSSSSSSSAAAPSESPASSTSSPRLFGMDAEMVYTSVGLELARLTVVDESGTTVLDELVRPARPVVDYNTRFSGITAPMLESVTTTLQDVRARVAAMVSANDVLVGHSLENDLRVLHLLHRRCLDTALLYSHPRGPPYKLSLKSLCAAHLARDIQTGGNAGHDSAEDALAALDLAKLKLRHGRAFGEPKRDREAIGTVLGRLGKQVSLIGHMAHIRDLCMEEPRYHAHLAIDDEATVAAACKQLAAGGGASSSSPPATALIVAQLHAMRNVPAPPPSEATPADASVAPSNALLPHPHYGALASLEAHLRRLMEAAKPNTLVLVASGQSSTIQPQQAMTTTTNGQPSASAAGPSAVAALEASKQGLLWLKIVPQRVQEPKAPAATSASSS
jgi:DNA polymerase III epsilon subunit-like protein